VSELYCGVMATKCNKKNLVKIMVSWGSNPSCLSHYLSWIRKRTNKSKKYDASKIITMMNSSYPFRYCNIHLPGTLIMCIVQ
jgi:desulfoferrodoxin (superoxide reductase-like protein)